MTGGGMYVHETGAAGSPAVVLLHGAGARDLDLHVRMVEAWLTGRELPTELPPERPSPATVDRLLSELGDTRARPDAANHPLQ